MKAYQAATIFATMLLIVVIVDKLFPQTGRLIFSSVAVILKVMALLKA